MCGIAGIISDNEHLGCVASLQAMTEAIRHRGPDDAGYYECHADNGCFVGLGHRRLSIIDIESGRQPITNEDQSIFLVFNGEIYNFEELRSELAARGHLFRTRSDSEVIVHAYEEYGQSCVTRFRGMFAFAIWDSREQLLFLGRDRFGKKPLFYRLQGSSFIFASEVKSLLAVQDSPAEINEQTIGPYSVYRYVPGPETFYRGIYKLEPGSTGTYRNGVFERTRYYAPPDKHKNPTQTCPGDPIAGFTAVLREAVNLRMISDVPFGAFLSGGLDSSAVVALMTEFSHLPVKTFSVGFRESDYSELKYAEEVARHFQTDHHELTVSHEELIHHLPDLISFRDAPVSEPSDIPIYLLAREASKTVKMVLTGEGSDEILAGYPKHVFERYQRLYRLLPRVVRGGLVEPIVNSLPYSFRRAKTAINTLGIENHQQRYPRWFGAISYADSAKLLKVNHDPSSIPSPTGPPFDADDDSTALRKILYFDQTSWLPDNLLERGDRMTMAASIEARMPFMDHELAEYVSRLPDKYRIRGRQTKWILREAMKRIIPERILSRPKVGFRLPVNEWFRGPLRDYLYDILLGTTSVSRDYYQLDFVKKMLKEHMEGRQNHEKLLWTMLNMELWCRQCITNKSGLPPVP